MTDHRPRPQMPDAQTRARIRHARDQAIRERERMAELDGLGRTLGRAQLERRYTELDRRIEALCT